jgi:hypothetical protein
VFVWERAVERNGIGFIEVSRVQEAGIPRVDGFGEIHISDHPQGETEGERRAGTGVRERGEQGEGLGARERDLFKSKKARFVFP